MKSCRVGSFRVYPLADESMGVRSMAIGVETSDVKILLDAGVSLAPRRYGLPPHPKEFGAAKAARERIMRFAEKADIVTVSHYHLDHYTPSFTSYYEWSSPDIFEELYSNKTIIVKRPGSDISFNQRRRAHVLLEELRRLGSHVIEGDEACLTFGSTSIKSLGVFPHGFEGPMGNVLCFVIEHGDHRLVYAPDVQGPIDPRALEAILQSSPLAVIIGGPPTYLSGYKVASILVEQGLSNLKMLASKALLIVSHHLLRDARWREKISGVDVHTYADLVDIKPAYLEATRKDLHASMPMSSTFTRWLERYRKGLREPPPL